MTPCYQTAARTVARRWLAAESRRWLTDNGMQYTIDTLEGAGFDMQAIRPVDCSDCIRRYAVGEGDQVKR